MGRKSDFNVEKAAMIMQKDAQYVRLGLQQQRLPFGSAVQKENGRWSYDIVLRAFCQYMNYTEEEIFEKLEELNKKKGSEKYEDN